MARSRRSQKFGALSLCSIFLLPLYQHLLRLLLSISICFSAFSKDCMATPVLFHYGVLWQDGITRGWGYHQGVGVNLFLKQGSSASRSGWVEGGLEESSHFHAHFLLLLRIQFLYARCNSQQAQLVSVVALEMLLFPPHGGRSQSDRFFSSSVFLLSVFSSALSLSRAFLSRRSALCRSHQATRQELRKPHVLYNKNLESF